MYTTEKKAQVYWKAGVVASSYLAATLHSICVAIR